MCLFSVGFTASISNGLQRYVCTGGAWSRTGSKADLVAPGGARLGTYSSVYDQQTRAMVYYWNIINSEGTYFESGQAISGLQGTNCRDLVCQKIITKKILSRFNCVPNRSFRTYRAVDRAFFCVHFDLLLLIILLGH